MLGPHAPGPVDLFHQYIPSTAAQSAKVVDVKHGLRASGIETYTREDDESQIVWKFLLKLGRAIIGL